METDEPPKLQHGIPEPETFLPGIPDWFWWLTGLGGLIVAALLYWIFRLVKPSPKPPRALERDLFTPAMEALEELEKESDKRLVSEIAAEASLAIRTYLANDRSEPALFETVEEFQARQKSLPADTNVLLNDLNEAKYAKSQIDKDRSTSFTTRAQECLESLRNRPAPERVPLTELDEKVDIRQRFSLIMAIAVPILLIVAVASFLLGLYDGSDTGSNFTIHPATWTALGGAVIAFFTHLITQPRR